MVMIFRSYKARRQLLDIGKVVTFRRRSRPIGRDWATDKRGGRKIADIVIRSSERLNRGWDPYRELAPCAHLSGFDDVDEWVSEIKRLNKGELPQEGWLFWVEKFS